MKEVIINKTEAQQRLDKFLIKYFPGANSSLLYKMLRKKNIVLNGKKATGNEKLVDGDCLSIYFSDETFDKFRKSSKNRNSGVKETLPSKAKANVNAKINADGNAKANTKVNADVNKNVNAKVKAKTIAEEETEKLWKQIRVLKETPHIVFLYKPAGILSQGSDSGEPSMNDWVLDYVAKQNPNQDFTLYKPSICNRLDRNTSGIIIAAKTYLGSRQMSELIREHRFGKYYYALLEGNLLKTLDEKTSWHEIKGYLYKDAKKNKVSIYETQEEAPKNLQAELSYIHTKYRVEAVYAGYTLVEIQLITGKPHQIRGHFAQLGHPLAGDIKYGGKPYQGKRYQLLHCYKLTFPSFEPDDMELSGIEVLADSPWDVPKNLISKNG